MTGDILVELGRPTHSCRAAVSIPCF